MQENERMQGPGEEPVTPGSYVRKLDPEDISLPEGYRIEVFAYGLDTPVSMVFTEEGDMIIGDAGVTTGNGKVIRLRNNTFEMLADGFNPPLTGLNYRNGDIYVSHKGKITVIRQDGSKQDVIIGLPSYGDHQNNQVVFGPDGKMYFGQGTATNSGVVGPDNGWVLNYPFFHDHPGAYIMLNGYNFPSENMLSVAGETVYTGAYSPYGIPNDQPNEVIKGIIKASGSILRANPDGSYLELVAWGLRNPFRIKFDRNNRLFAANQGADVRGSRPIANCPDEFQLITPGAWYGWPDYTGGQPVTLPEYKPENGPQPEFLLSEHPSVPPEPFALFTPHSSITGFDFNYNQGFGIYGNAFIAEFGSEAPGTTGGIPLPGVGRRISEIDMESGTIDTFAINRSGLAASEDGGGGFERPIDVVFGPDGAMYVLDFAVASPGEPGRFRPNTGVIWRITKNP